MVQGHSAAHYDSLKKKKEAEAIIKKLIQQNSGLDFSKGLHLP